MSEKQLVHKCGCADCVSGSQAEQDEHRQLNLLMSRLDEQQRRWLAAREAIRLGHGGFQRLCEITGLHPETIRRGRDELNDDLKERPRDQIRLPGGGRPRVEKKIRL